jgi:putative peptidoglycan lipid II flippase
MSLARDVTTVGAATLVSRLLAFLRDAGVATVLGAGPLSDAYFAALQIPNLFRRLLAEGALNAAFVPMWLRIDKDGPAATQRFGEDILGATAVALLAVTILCMIFAPAIVDVLVPGFGGQGERFALAVGSCACRFPMSRCAASSPSQRRRSTPPAGSPRHRSASPRSTLCWSSPCLRSSRQAHRRLTAPRRSWRRR